MAIANEIGVVVIGRNEGKRLSDCLKSLQSSVKCVVYVDSGSTDGSLEVATQFGVCVVSLDPCRPFTAARARNEGFSFVLKNTPDIQFVQFIDGDCELDKEWLSIAHHFINRREDIAIVSGRRRERHPSASIYNRLFDIEWNTRIGQASACGGDSLVRVEAFEAVGGFREGLVAGEEPELCLRLRQAGWIIWRLDAEMTRHDAAMMRFGQWWRRSVRYGYGVTELSHLHWSSPLATWKRQLASTLFWGGVLPIAIVFGSLLHPLVLAATLLYPIQIFRIAVARGITSPLCWTYASLVTLGKFAASQGVLKYYSGSLQRKSTNSIEYK